MSYELKKMSKQNDSQEKPLPRPPLTPKAIKELEKTSKTTNEWLRQIFYALAVIAVMMFGILLKALA